MDDTSNPKHVLSEALGRTESCIAVEDLGVYSEGSGTPEFRQRVQSHLHDCAYCRTELSLLEEFAAGAVRPGEEQPVQWIVTRLEGGRVSTPAARARREPRRWWLTSWSLGPAIAAAAVVLLAAYVWNLRSSSPGTLQPHSYSGPEVLRSTAISTIEPRDDVSSVPTAFRWRGTEGATKYRVELTEVDGTPLWTPEVTGMEVPIPPEIAARIVPAKTLLWRVEAIDSSGSIIGRSDSQRFRLVVGPKSH